VSRAPLSLTGEQCAKIAEALRLLSAQTDTRALAYERDSVYATTEEQHARYTATVRALLEESTELRALARLIDPPRPVDPGRFLLGFGAAN